MGWDAFSSISDGKTVIQEFKSKAEEIKSLCWFVDGGFEYGILDCSDCGFCIRDITGIDPFEEVNSVLSNEVIKSINLDIIPDNKQRDWAYVSAWHFLNLCKELDLSIRFSC